jgi:hypothetical protein
MTLRTVGSDPRCEESVIVTVYNEVNAEFTRTESLPQALIRFDEFGSGSTDPPPIRRLLANNTEGNNQCIDGEG